MLGVVQSVLIIIIAATLPFNIVFFNDILTRQNRIIVDDTLKSGVSEVKMAIHSILEEMRVDMKGDRSSLTFHYYSDDPYLVSDSVFRYSQPVFASVFSLSTGPNVPDIAYRRQNNSLAGYSQVGKTMSGECLFRTARKVTYARIVEKWTAGLIIRCPIYDPETNAVVAHIAMVYKEIDFDQNFILQKMALMRSYVPEFLRALKNG